MEIFNTVCIKLAFLLMEMLIFVSASVKSWRIQFPVPQARKIIDSSKTWAPWDFLVQKMGEVMVTESKASAGVEALQAGAATPVYTPNGEQE